MASSTLYREGDDLDTLLSDLSAEFGPAVRVVAVEEDRAAGLRGRLARPRVGVQFRIEADEIEADEQSVSAGLEVPPAADPLAELIDRAEAAEAEPARPATPIPAAEADPVDHAEFAAMLRDLAAAKAARRNAPSDDVADRSGRRPRPRPVPAAPPAAPQLAAAPLPAAAPPAAPHPAPTAAQPAAPPATTFAAPRPADSPLVLRRQLSEIGVPIHLLPDTATDPVRAVRAIVAALPETPQPPVGRGAILAVAGPAAELIDAGRYLAAAFSIEPERVWTAGLPTGAVPGALILADAWDAAAAARGAREHPGRLVLALVATDADHAAGVRQPAGVLAALRAEATWAVVDATRKPADLRRQLAALGPVTAAVVTNAADTASPATVLELGLPVALLDGRPATRRRWLEALLAALPEAQA